MFLFQSGICQTWDEEKCPSGVVSKDYSDTTRILNAEISDDVVLLDNKNITLFKCPLIGEEDFSDHNVFITTRQLDISVGQIMSSEQAGGVLHRVGLISNLGKL